MTLRGMPLTGVKVLEFCGLAPGPYCGKILCDFGASVTVVDKIYDNPLNVLSQGKKIVAINLKHPKSPDIIKDFCKTYDVVLDPFRPGVMEKLKIGPEILCKENPRLIYARLTGFGQSGPLVHTAGHDINYAAISGVLSFFGRKGGKPTPPLNILADFAGGGLLCALGICLALLERHHSGRGQIVDSSMTEGAAYIASWFMMSQHLPIWSGNGRGTNMLDGGLFYYDTYETKDGKFMAVGALEPAFFEIFITKLGLPQLSQDDPSEECRALIGRKFLTKTQQEWTEIFENSDACVTPILEWNEAMEYHHNKQRGSFIKTDQGTIIPKPSPLLSETPGRINMIKEVSHMDAVAEILADIGKTKNDVNKLFEEGVLVNPTRSNL